MTCIIILMQEMIIRQCLKIYEAKMLAKCHTKILVYFTASYPYSFPSFGIRNKII